MTTLPMSALKADLTLSLSAYNYIGVFIMDIKTNMQHMDRYDAKKISVAESIKSSHKLSIASQVKGNINYILNRPSQVKKDTIL